MFSDILAYSLAMNAVNLADRSRLALGEVVSGNYFQLLGVQARLGRTLLPDDDVKGAPRVVVISYRLWTRDYGSSPSVIGQTIRLHGQRYTIVGVAPRDVHGRRADSLRRNVDDTGLRRRRSPAASSTWCRRRPAPARSTGAATAGCS